MAGNDTPDFATLLRRYRRERRLTQEELAGRAGVSPEAISLLERGLTQAPQRGTVELLMAAFGLSPDESTIFAAAARHARWAERGADQQTAAVDETPSGSVGGSARTEGNLPVPLTPLFGRKRDEDALLSMLDDPATRLLTLTGAAGVGKTRLALRVAMRLQQERRQEVVFVDLIPVHDPDRVLSAIAAALGLQESGDLSLRDMVIHALRRRHVTLILDNFEQALSAARIVLELLIGSLEVKALVTSRWPLNVRGERCYPVMPLALPDSTQRDSLDDLRAVPTVALFVERAVAAQPDFALTTLEEGRLVADICARLDGLPLAIELAAARIKHVGLRRLGDWVTQPSFLEILTDGPQDLADHQRTMRSTIAWSYNLLSAERQKLFRWLGVFVGGASVDVVAAVTEWTTETLLANLANLVDAHLLRRTDTGGAERYTQLVTLQAYAQEQLRANGEWDEARRRLAEYFRDLTQRIDWRVTDQPEGLLALLQIEYENVRAALAWAWETDAIDHGLRMVGRLRRYWDTRAQFREGLDWLERFIARADAPENPEERELLAQAWTGALVMSYRLDRLDRACEAAEAALALRRASGDSNQIAGALGNLANIVAPLHDYERARALYEECLTLYREAGERQGMVFPLFNLGNLYVDTGRPREALAYYEESLALSRAVGESELARAATWNGLGEALIVLDEPLRAIDVTTPAYRCCALERSDYWVANCAWTLGRAYWRLGDATAAGAYLDEAVDTFEALGSIVGAARVRYFRASLALAHGDVTGAQGDLAQALTALVHRTDASEYLWWLIERVGTLACQRGALERAAHLHRAAIAHRDVAPRLLDPAERDLRQCDLDRLRAEIDEKTLATLFVEGEALTLDAAIALARQELGPVGR
ncbi:MAG TPA: tetratricopeptide repeat protein [Ktedonobacterales bacterium]|jgi:predicted ATPase/transcriptional regulator with XRE-family HTH domain